MFLWNGSEMISCTFSLVVMPDSSSKWRWSPKSVRTNRVLSKTVWNLMWITNMERIPFLSAIQVILPKKNNRFPLTRAHQLGKRLFLRSKCCDRFVCVCVPNYLKFSMIFKLSLSIAKSKIFKTYRKKIQMKQVVCTSVIQVVVI